MLTRLRRQGRKKVPVRHSHLDDTTGGALNEVPLKKITIVDAGEGVYPETDGTKEVGNATKRWGLVRAVTITSGDLGFEETACYLCKKPFALEDEIILVVTSISRVEIRCVPAHRKCPECWESYYQP